MWKWKVLKYGDINISRENFNLNLELNPVPLDI